MFFVATGTVKWFDDARGYGFKSLAESACVEFEARQGSKGLEAASVALLA